MSDEEVITFCAPTLTGIKTGSLFNTPFGSRSEAIHDLRSLNERLVRRDMRVLPMGWIRDRLLLYVYRPSWLKKDLSDERCRKILAALGYEPTDPDRCVKKLIERMHEQGSFPHEIGFFLGYPIEDVICFMENREGKAVHDVKYCGTWQAYGNAEEARNTDRKYHLCTESCLRHYRHGTPLDQLMTADPKKTKENRT